MGRPPVTAGGSARDRLCAAMVELVGERGFKATTIDDLVRQAGVDRPSFARHFDSRETCFAAAWDEVDADLNRRMAAAFERRQDWPDRLRDSLEAGMRYLAGDEGRARFYVAEVLYVSDEMRDRQHVAMARLAVAIDHGRETREADRAPADISHAIAGAIWHRVRQLVQIGQGSDLSDQVPRFMYLAVLPYRGADAAQAELDGA